MRSHRKTVIFIFIFYFACICIFLITLPDLNNISDNVLQIEKSYLVTAGIYGTFNQTRSRNDSLHSRISKRHLSDSIPLLATELARRKLFNDEQELWYFMAAQLGLHQGHLIDILPTVNHVITSLHEYHKMLLVDQETYLSELKNEPEVPTEETYHILNNLSERIEDFFNRTITELNNLQNKTGASIKDLSKETKRKIRSIHIFIRVLLGRLWNVKDDVSNWRYRESMDIKDQIWKEIHRLQNPENCSTARTLHCGKCGGIKCGFACIAEQVSLCLLTAYVSNRTMVFDCERWSYSSRGWESAFLPINSKCTPKQTGHRKPLIFKKTQQVEQVLDPNIEAVSMNMPFYILPFPEIFPQAVPQDLKDRLLRFNAHPPSWWFGQFKAWIIRLNKDLSQEVELHIKALDIKHPVVGLHVRRTDKRSEAAFHDLYEYMQYAEEWFDEYEIDHPGTNRTIYLATDEHTIIKEANEKYPNYEFIHDVNISTSASQGSRYNEKSLRGLLKDMNSLLHCDFIVCTFSSKFCRYVYEVMQTQNGDVTHRFQSLDDIYFAAGQNVLLGQATESHKPQRSNEIELKQGDIIQLHGNHWDGFSLGAFSSKHKKGVYPSYKVQSLIRTFKRSSKVKNR